MNTPVLDESRGLRYIIHRVEDVTDYVRLRRADDVQQREVELQARQVAAASRELKQANAELAELARERAVNILLVEQDRMALVLNQRVITRLFDVSMSLGGARTLATGAVGDLIDAAVATLDQVMAEIRSTIFATDQGHETALHAAAAVAEA